MLTVAGVSEGQYEIVLKKEFPRIQEGVTRVFKDKDVPNPKFMVVVAAKRHHARFYPVGGKYVEENGNPPAGTVVDRAISMGRGYDFYLQAHHALQGTARPTPYVVIKDDCRMGADEIQQLTHGLCYLFSRATKGVSLCPPAYYADIA